MRALILGVIVASSFIACGGGGGDSSNSTTVNNCPGESVHVGDLEEVVAAAQDAGVEVEDHSEDSAPAEDISEPEQEVPGLNQGATLREGGVIVATCGGTVIANDSVSSGAARVLARIASGDVYKIEIYRGE